MEQVTGQELISLGRKEITNLHYYARNRNEGSAEVDFILQHHNRVIAFEVKEGSGNKMKSLCSMLDRDLHRVITPIRVSWDQFKVEQYHYNKKSYQILSLPFYLLNRWPELIGCL